MSFQYFNKGEKESLQFYRLPVLLLRDPVYRNLSSGAKILFTCMQDRRELSEKNGWKDKYEHIFIYYTLQQICYDLAVCKQKASRLLDELEAADLIMRVKQGMGRPTRIYVGLMNKERRPELVRQSDRPSEKVVCGADHSGEQAVCETYPVKDERHPPEVTEDILHDGCRTSTTYTDNTDTEYIYTESESGDREPASREAYEREIPKTREEVLEEYQKMNARGEEDMRLIELMLLATNDTVGEPRRLK